MFKLVLLPAAFIMLASAQMPAQMPQGGWTEEAAVPAATLADSVGVNVHLNYASYESRYNDVKRLLLDSGIKHVRNSLGYDSPDQGIARMNDLAQSGIKSDVLFDVRSTAAQVTDYMTRLAPSIELAEGANELDAARYPDWRNAAIADQKKLYPLAHARGLGVIGPVMTSYQATAQVGDLHDYLDYGNLHNYFSGFNPGTTGWGGIVEGTVYGSLAYNKKLASLISGDKPVMSTETGYCTLSGIRGAVTPEIAARYLPRLLLEQWNGHVARTYIYELMDEGKPGCDAFLGLVNHDLMPKPGYVAVRSFMHEIGSFKSSQGPAKLAFRLNGNLERIHHTVIQTKANELAMFVWNESPSWDVHAGTGEPIAVAPRDVQLTVKSPWHIASIRSFRDDGSIAEDGAQHAAATSTLSVSDHVTVVRLRR